jgi:hypothetical protein
LAESAIAAEVPAKAGERDEDLWGETDNAAFTLIAEARSSRAQPFKIGLALISLHDSVFRL